ncbi:MAG: hypothetical protein N3H30_02100 [Candidatus Micrarchaeota archaeon]|nr:hypothetical protein [Candidatus Micrarchaeota archaeon]
MAERKEIEEVIGWCKKRKEEAGHTPIIELNPFRERFSWMLSRIRLAIDLPLEDAKDDMAVYDTPTDSLYIKVAGRWIRVEPDDIFER